MARQIVEEQQRDVGSQIGQAIAGGTSAYFDELHKANIRATERDRVNEALRHNRAAESLSALGVASTLTAENIRDRRARELAESDKTFRKGLQDDIQSFEREQQRARFAHEKAISEAEIAGKIAASRAEIAADQYAFYNDPENWNKISQMKARWDDQFIEDVGKIKVPHPTIPGKMIKLPENYPRELYYQVRYPDDYNKLRRYYSEMYKYTPEALQDDMKGTLHSLETEFQTEGDLKLKKEWITENRESIMQQPGGKLFIQRAEQQIQDWGNRLAVTSPDEYANALVQGEKNRLTGASGAMEATPLSFTQRREAGYDKPFNPMDVLFEGTQGVYNYIKEGLDLDFGKR